MRPRVFQVITRLIAGGAQENTILLCQALRERFDVTLVSGPPDGREGSLVEEARQRGIPLVIVPDLVRPVSPLRDAAALRDLIRLFRRERPHVVHTNSSKAGILGRAAAWWADVPVVVHTNHGLPFYEEQPAALRAFYRALEKAAASVSDRIVCVGEVVRRKSIAARLGPPRLFEVIYNGFETERFLKAQGIRDRLGIPPEVPVAGIVARMAWHKGHRFLVEAAPPTVHLLFVGDGEERPVLERRVADRGLRATFTGHVSPSEVPGLIASMDVLVHPSLWEGLPRVAVEALLVGRPVVAFDRDGVREVVIDGVTGRLVPAKSIGALRAALDEILARPDRGHDLGRAGREICLERFDGRRSAERVADLYRALLEGIGVRVL